MNSQNLSPRLQGQFHEAFKRQLRGSERYRLLGAAMLAHRGHEVTIPPFRVAEEYEDREAYSDGGDLIVNGRVVEIKSTREKFTGRHDWPFRAYNVCKEASLKPRTLWWICFSVNGSHYGLVKGNTRKKWRRVMMVDRSMGDENRYPGFQCPLHLVEWGEVPPQVLQMFRVERWRDWG